MSGPGSAYDDLLRWEASGGRWQVLDRTPDRVEIALLTCSTGEEMARLRTDDPRVRAYVAGRRDSEQDPPDVGS